MALTRFRSGITVLTEDFCNSIYGGLYGTEEGNELDVLDPLVAGHIHDGSHANGSAQKINLEDHVTGQLDGANIQDNSITPAKLTEFSFDGIWSSASNVISNSPGDLATDDLVFGSNTLNDAGTVSHDSRLFFDKSLATFHAGQADSTQ